MCNKQRVKISLGQGEEWIQAMKPKTDGQRRDKCISISEHCQEAAESSLLVGWSGIIMPDLTLITLLSASSLPGRTSVKAWFKKTENFCKHCTIAWDKMVIQGTEFPDVPNIYFYRTRRSIGSVHGCLTTARGMLLKEENKPKLSFCLVLHWVLSPATLRTYRTFNCTVRLHWLVLSWWLWLEPVFALWDANK